MKGTPVSLRKPGASGLSGSESKHLERLEESQRADGTDEACVRPGCPRSCLPASQHPPTWLPGSRSPPSVCRKASPDPTLHFDLLTLHQALADGAFTHPSSLGLPTATRLGPRPVSSTPQVPSALRDFDLSASSLQGPPLAVSGQSTAPCLGDARPALRLSVRGRASSPTSCLPEARRPGLPRPLGPGTAGAGDTAAPSPWPSGADPVLGEAVSTPTTAV